MNSSPLFCSRLELGKLTVSSGLLHLSWSKIKELDRSIDPNQDSNLRFKIYQEAKHTVVAFVAPTICTRKNLFRDDGSVNTELTLLDGSSGSDAFRFLSENISSFSVHSTAYQLFASVYGSLVDLKSQLLSSEKPLIITGFELGGSVASLFTLWLLDTIRKGRKRPLSITFGSPLIGDAKLQQILENSIRNSCLLHVVSIRDPFPKLLILDSKAAIFKPFGTFLLCCESECVCVEDPDAVLELLASINGGLTLPHKWNVYDEIPRRLESSSVLMGAVSPGESVSNRLLAGMFLQPDHIGSGSTQDDQVARVIRNVIMGMEARAKMKLQFDPFKRLGDLKITMAKLEWYKKACTKVESSGYYDHFKKFTCPVIPTVEKFKKELTEDWKTIVEVAEKKPQSEIATLRKRFLCAGTNYRRMVEPLDIAEHYRHNSSENYINRRSRHYVLLERWFEEAKEHGNVSMNRVLSNLLTLDSCFWARVEEAIKLLKNRRTTDGEMELLRFEEYVWEEISERRVSPEIFLEESSFMSWWTEYKSFKGDDRISPFTNYMNKRRYKNYGMPQNISS